jgi:hypothetical protein
MEEYCDSGTASKHASSAVGSACGGWWKVDAVSRHAHTFGGGEGGGCRGGGGGGGNEGGNGGDGGSDGAPSGKFGGGGHFGGGGELGDGGLGGGADGGCMRYGGGGAPALSAGSSKVATKVLFKGPRSSPSHASMQASASATAANTFQRRFGLHLRASFSTPW